MPCLVPQRTGHGVGQLAVRELGDIGEPPGEGAHPRTNHLGVQRLSLRDGPAGDDIESGDGIGLRALLARLEALAIDLHRIEKGIGGEVGREGIGQAEVGRQLRSEER